MKIKEEALKKINSWVALSPGEVGGLLVGELNKGEFIINDALLLKQKVASASFYINDKAISDLTKTADDDTLKSIIGWWHSHADFGVFYSYDDINTFDRLARLSDNGICVGIVINKKEDINGRVDVIHNDTKLVFENMPVNVIVPTPEVIYTGLDYSKYLLDDGNFDWSKFELLDNEATKINSSSYSKKEFKALKTEFKKKVKIDKTGEIDFVACPHCNGYGRLEKFKTKGKVKTRAISHSSHPQSSPSNYGDKTDKANSKSLAGLFDIQEDSEGQYKGTALGYYDFMD